VNVLGVDGKWGQQSRRNVLVLELEDMKLAQLGIDTQWGYADTPIHKLEADQARRALHYWAYQGDFRLTVGGQPIDLEVKHDVSSTIFGQCTNECKIVGPKYNTRYGVVNDTIAGVKFLYTPGQTSGFKPWPHGIQTDQEPETKTGAGLGISYWKAIRTTNDTRLTILDPRTILGLNKLCKELQRRFQVLCIFHAGTGEHGRVDSHGEGRAVDFSGCSFTLPEPGATVSAVGRFDTIFVATHWGAITPWDPDKAPGQWERWKGKLMVSSKAGGGAPPGSKNQVFRLRGPIEPMLDGLIDKSGDVEAQKARWPAFMDVARQIFEVVYAYGQTEFQVSNQSLPEVLGDIGVKPVCTMHPDHPTSYPGTDNGREAHQNHIHFQVGETKTTNNDFGKNFKSKRFENEEG
jgi:hypothetical protein